MTGHSPPRDINAPFRERSAARGWGRVHVDSDARAPVGMYQPSRLSRFIAAISSPAGR